MRWSTNKRLHLEMGLIQAVHSLAQANISDIIRALDGAPLPDTPIATTVLPEIPLPPVGAEPQQPAVAPAPEPQAVEAPPPAPEMAPPPVEKEPPPAPEPDPAPAPAPAPEPEPAPEPPTAGGLEPIDDAPPLFGDMPPMPEPEESAFISPVPTPRSLRAEEWETVLDAVSKQAPLKAQMIGHTLFVSDEDGVITVAIHPEDTDSRDALLGGEVADLVCDAAAELCARKVRLRVVVDDTVPPPSKEVIPPPPLLTTPAPAPKPSKPAPEKKPAEEPPPASPSLRPSEDEFYRDPLIELALEKFNARLIK